MAPEASRGCPRTSSLQFSTLTDVGRHVYTRPRSPESYVARTPAYATTEILQRCTVWPLEAGCCHNLARRSRRARGATRPSRQTPKRVPSAIVSEPRLSSATSSHAVAMLQLLHERSCRILQNECSRSVRAAARVGKRRKSSITRPSPPRIGAASRGTGAPTRRCHDGQAK